MKKFMIAILVMSSINTFACQCDFPRISSEAAIENTLNKYFIDGFEILNTELIKRYQTLADIINEKVYEGVTFNPDGSLRSIDSCTSYPDENGKTFHSCSNRKTKVLYTLKLDDGKVCELILKIKEKREEATVKIKDVKCN